MDKKEHEVYNTFAFATDQEKMKLTEIMEKMDEFCIPRKNIRFSRYKFFTCGQREGEPFDDFVTNQKKLSQDCEFGTLCDSLIRDLIIIGILDNHLRERLLREHDLTLETLSSVAKQQKRPKNMPKFYSISFILKKQLFML